MLFAHSFLLFLQSEMKQVVVRELGLRDHKRGYGRQPRHDHKGSVLLHEVPTSFIAVGSHFIGEQGSVPWTVNDKRQIPP